MAKNKKSGIPHYELLYIVANKFTEDDLKGINSRVNKLIEKTEGKITFKEDWGKKKFCFPIEHGKFGYYQFIEFDMPSEKIEKINTELRMSPEVLRHMIVNHAPKTAKQIEVEKRLEEKRLAYKASKKLEEKTSRPAKKEVPKAKKKVDSKELNAKLDKILETDDLL
jgi:small subunit ribosomal protein S6